MNTKLITTVGLLALLTLASPSHAGNVLESPALLNFFNDEPPFASEDRTVLQKDFLRKPGLRVYIGAGAGVIEGCSVQNFRIFAGLTVALNIFSLKSPESLPNGVFP